ncbi:MAG: hypothetical protein AB1758_38220, partial [Candidatus Eremiobacterota bacterium]
MLIQGCNERAGFCGYPLLTLATGWYLGPAVALAGARLLEGGSLHWWWLIALVTAMTGAAFVAVARNERRAIRMREDCSIRAFSGRVVSKRVETVEAHNEYAGCYTYEDHYVLIQPTPGPLRSE